MDRHLIPTVSMYFYFLSSAEVVVVVDLIRN